ncbi:MAG TPA: thermonuclease family protein [Planctomycetota bacterium]|nr:thermonuclease family protein [Planctomycetota bacterium]
MPERTKWLYLLIGLLVGSGAVLAFEHFPGGRGDARGGALEFRFQEGRTYTVQRVLDGDTIVVEPGIRLRYAGINAPETTRTIEEPQPFALEAKDVNQRLVANRQVRLTVAPGRFDVWGRLLAGVEVQDPESGRWMDVEEELLRAGLAKRVSYAGALRNEVRLKKAEEAAKASGLGLWPGAAGGPASRPKPPAPPTSEARAPTPDT